MRSKDWLQPAPGANLAGQLSRPSVNGIRRKTREKFKDAGQPDHYSSSTTNVRYPTNKICINPL